jgi:hypothetical protein
MEVATAWLMEIRNGTINEMQMRLYGYMASIGRWWSFNELVAMHADAAKEVEKGVAQRIRRRGIRLGGKSSGPGCLQLMN